MAAGAASEVAVGDPLRPVSRGLIAAKLQRPWTRQGLVQRAALLARLEGAEQPILGLVAPAGYGKTTVLGQMADRTPFATAWLSLDSFDNDPNILFRYLIAALAQIDPVGAVDWADAVDEAGVQPGSALRRMAMIVSSIQVPFLLTLDHAEAVTNPSAGDLIAAVALNLPPGGRLAVGSRTALPLGDARLRAQGQLAIVGPDELAMGIDEADALVQAAGVDLSDDEVRAVVARTEGWAVGIYLAGLSMAQDAPEAGSSRPIPRGSDRAIVDYLRAEVTATLPASTMSFLVRTSVLERLSAPLCDAVLGAKGSRGVLDSLEQSNLLLVPLDRERRWYRCHHLLREMLQEELQRTEPELVGPLHDRAAAWFEIDGQAELAIDHAMAAGDADRVARLVATLAATVHGSGRTETFFGWVAWFEERGNLQRYPEVAVTAGIAEALTGSPHRVDALLASVSAHGPLGAAPDGSPLEAWAGLLRATLARQGVQRMLADALEVRRTLNPASAYGAGAAFLTGVGYYLLGDVEAADVALDDAADFGRRYGGAPTGAAAIALRAVLAIDRGDWQSAAALSEQAQDFVSERRLDLHVQTMLVNAVAARVAARSGDIVLARAALAAGARARSRCARGMPVLSIFLVQLANAHLAAADPGGARAVLRQAQELLASSEGFEQVEAQCATVSRALDSIRVDGLGASSLTAAELRLLPLLATHLSYREIGERLYVSRNTVKTQAVSMFRKLGVTSRGEAIEAAERWGLLNP